MASITELFTRGYFDFRPAGPYTSEQLQAAVVPRGVGFFSGSELSVPGYGRVACDEGTIEFPGLQRGLRCGDIEKQFPSVRRASVEAVCATPNPTFPFDYNDCLRYVDPELVRLGLGVQAQIKGMTTFAEPQSSLQVYTERLQAACGSSPSPACALDFNTRLQAFTNALAAMSIAMPSASPTGGSMSAPWFGLGGASPGGTTPIMPFGLPFQAGGGFGLPVPADAAGGTGGSIFGQILQSIPGILTGLSNAGVIGGTVGRIFATEQAPQPIGTVMVPQQNQIPAGQQVLVGANGQLVLGPMQASASFQLVDPATGGTVGQQGPSWMTGCAPRGPKVVDMMSVPGLFRPTCSGQLRPAGRVIVQGPDGNRDLFVRVGRIASPSQRVLKGFAKRWAKAAGLTASTRGGQRRARRRPR